MPLKPPRASNSRPNRPRWDQEDRRYAWRTLLGSVVFLLAVALPAKPILAYARRCQTPEIRASLPGHRLASLRCSSAEIYTEKHWWALGAGGCFLVLAVAMLILLRWMPVKERTRRERYYGRQ